MRRRRGSGPKPPQTKIDKDPIRKFVCLYVNKLLHQRMLGLSQCPYSNVELYWKCFPEDEIKAIQFLDHRYPGKAFESASRAYVYDDRGPDRGYITLVFDQPVLQLSGVRLTMRHYTEEMLAVLDEWRARRMKAAMVMVKIDNGLRSLMNAAVTYGQIRAFWPQLERFMPGEIQDKIAAVKRSRVSEAMIQAWYTRTGTTSPAEFQCDQYLAEGIMFDGMELATHPAPST